jgi:putative ABC transport system permease protein
MRLLYRLIALARSLFHPGRADADVADELRFHIEREAELNVRRGMTNSGAYRAARLKVGSVPDAIETARDERPGSTLRQIGRDMQFGARLLAKSPGFALAGITVIALGIAAVTAIFSVVYGVMLRPLPFRDPGRLVSIWSQFPALGVSRGFPNAADVAEWRRSNRVFSDIALVRTTANLNLIGAGAPERIQGARFSPNLLPVLGVTPAIGRNFTADENQPGRDQVVLLSDGLWRERFAADPAIVGRTIQLNGLPHTVIGVMPSDFQYPSREYRAWVPLVIDPRELTREVTQNYLAVARLENGVTVSQAQQELDAIAKRLAAEFPATNRELRVLAQSMLESTVGDIRAPLVALLAASACLLLIACLNLGNLLGARAAARSGEFAVRLALGASRRRIALQAVAEVVPLLVAGGVLGVLAAVAGVRAFVAMSPPMPRLESVEVSLPVIVVSAVVLLLTGIVATIVPAMHAWRADFTAMTKDGGRAATQGRAKTSARRLGVATQIAFAVPLLVGASLLIRSSLRLARVDLGFDAEHVSTFHLAVPRTKYASDADVAAFYDRVLSAVSALPGVRHAGMVNRLPLVGNQTMSIHVERAPGDIANLSAIDSRPVTPDYFAALGIAQRGGRAFSARDDQGAAPVAIVDERLAAEMWPNQSPVGKRIQRFDDVWCTVVGVVAHVHANGVDVDPRPQVYWPYRHVTQDRMALVVRSETPPGSMIAPVIQAIRALDAEQPVYDIRLMTDVVDRSLVQRRLTTALISVFGAIALVLAAVGIYGVVAYGAAQRLREFGIRVALGATTGEIAAIVLREGSTMALMGAVAGLAGAAALSGAMTKLVFEIDPRDVVSFGAAALVLGVVTLVASYIPARRASAVDPAVTLRAE